MPTSIPTTTLPSGIALPVLGQGSWHMGESPATAAAEADSLRLGLDLGMTLIDTAEMYANGGAERVVGAAISGRRDSAFIVSKVLPSNASRAGTIKACERSLAALGTDRIELYLLHWRGGTPLAETVEAFEQLKQAGKIGDWGVSNFDVDDLADLKAAGGASLSTNQVLYNLSERGIEFDLLPLCQKQGLPVMAYSPLDEGRLVHHPEVVRLAKAHQATPAQLALAFVLARPGVIAIPKTGSPARVRENLGALELRLTPDDLTALDAAFPAPTHKTPLAII